MRELNASVSTHLRKARSNLQGSEEHQRNLLIPKSLNEERNAPSVSVYPSQ